MTWSSSLLRRLVWSSRVFYIAIVKRADTFHPVPQLHQLWREIYELNKHGGINATLKGEASWTASEESSPRMAHSKEEKLKDIPTLLLTSQM